MNSMIIQSKKVKKLWTKFDCRPGRAPSRRVVHRQHSPHVRSPFVLLLCAQKLDTAKDLRPDHSKLKILKKFPKLKH